MWMTRAMHAVDVRNRFSLLTIEVYSVEEFPTKLGSKLITKATN